MNTTTKERGQLHLHGGQRVPVLVVEQPRGWSAVWDGIAVPFPVFFIFSFKYWGPVWEFFWIGLLYVSHLWKLDIQIGDACL